GDVLSGIIAGADAGDGLFPARRTHLTKSWRQHEALDLAPLAAAVREGDSAKALELLRSGRLSRVHFPEDLADPLQAPRDPPPSPRSPPPSAKATARKRWSCYAAADSPASTSTKTSPTPCSRTATTCSRTGARWPRPRPPRRRYASPRACACSPPCATARRAH